MYKRQEQLIGQEFTISDLLVLVGKKYYLRFYIVLSKMGLIDSMKSRKKINIFKISWDFNITSVSYTHLTLPTKLEV
ncbi:hypothetical protein PVA38_12385 [Streptococcus pneumoniae D39]|nr:hypothetical protein PVA38_12385 [Streptococcus pneumoniae D39]